MKKLLLGCCLILACAQTATAQVIYATMANPSYTQQFDSLARRNQSNILPFAWYFWELGSSLYADGMYETTHTISGPNVFSLGDDVDPDNIPVYVTSPDTTDRALGSAVHKVFCPYARFGLKIMNGEADSLITGFNMSYRGETWKQLTSTQIDTMQLYYSVDADSLGDTLATWVPIPELSFTMQVGLDTPNLLFYNQAGNMPENVKNVTGMYSGLNVMPGAEFYLMWQPRLHTGSQSGLAGIDDLNITLHFGGANGIAPSGKRLYVSCYPNPADEFINVSIGNNTSEVYWTITGSAGKTSRSGVFHRSSVLNRTMPVNVSGLIPGSYMITLVTAEGQKGTSHFIKR